MSQAYLDEVHRRWPILESVATEPHTLGELEESLSMSRSTIHRACQTLLEMGVLERTDNEYRLTPLGSVVTTETERYRSRLLTARRLERFLNVTDASDIDVPIEHFNSADVVLPQHRQAHNGLKRIKNLIEETDSLRMFSSIISPIYVDMAVQEMERGTNIEVIFDEEVLDIILEEYVEEAKSAMEAGHIDVNVGEQLPFELFIADDVMGLAAHNESGLPQIFIEASNAKAMEWAVGLYERYKAEATSFTLDKLPQTPSSVAE